MQVTRHVKRYEDELACLAGAWKCSSARKERAHERETVSPSRAHVLSCAYYFQAPATQA